ncbi:carbohydrate esterase [Actinoplanes flavus]|uniref:Carbohydrate esterase n=1 Tax=Actinoplanes flavus TaxID=2820290 RepID=A0ABS3URA1_9ACTN|nr:carbohydrate esterase [Actinoplanes flavus]MBO3741309.1 carbohydrate esterase [Actinoplanes flavus]
MRSFRLLIATALAVPLLLAAPASAELPGCGIRSAAAAAAAAPTTVWLAGDSTMANPSATCPVGWGASFDPLFTGDVVVDNLALGGRSIQTWLYEGNVTSTIGADGECVLSSTTASARWQRVLDGMKAGDYLFIQFGINDGSTTCPRHVGVARYQQLMTMMARTALARGAHPVLLTAVAAITCSGGTAVKNRGFVTPAQAAAAATGAPLIDLQTLSVNHYNAVRLCPNNGDYTAGLVGRYFCNDHTHFEAYGAQRIAGLVAGALRTQNIPLATYLL